MRPVVLKGGQATKEGLGPSPLLPVMCGSVTARNWAQGASSVDAVGPIMAHLEAGHSYLSIRDNDVVGSRVPAVRR